MPLSPLHIEKQWFKDPKGRTVILRGVNLGGDSKVPYPRGGTHYPTDFSDHKEVSFIGRPFPLEQAHEHFSRLKAYGFNVLRLLTTWEAIEHKGPYDFDDAYMKYYATLCQMAGDYGMYIFVDFHQDVWSRMSGGDGAPGWLFEKIGLDYRKFGTANAALIMQRIYDYQDPTPYQEAYPCMCWQMNYRYPANAIMWSLFFAGKMLTPDFLIEDELTGRKVDVQSYLQGHYLACQSALAEGLKDFPNILGFDSLNEPSPGWIGKPMNFRHIKGTKDNSPLPGTAFSPIDGLYVSHGYSLEIPCNEFQIIKLGVRPAKNIVINPEKVSIWLQDKEDPFAQAGAWKLNDDGSYTILHNDFFQKVKDHEIRFNRDCLAPFYQSVADNIRQHNPNWMVFIEKEPAESMLKPGFPTPLPHNIVNASHWYDGLTLLNKKFRKINIDLTNYLPVAGHKGIQKKYIHELGRIMGVSTTMSGGCPTLIGEVGLPFDLDNGKAYNKYLNGDRSSRPWKNHITAFDLMYNALDHLLLNATLWNYSAGNRNDPRIGDGFNQEDLSIWSQDQQADPADIYSGGRAMEGWLRPYVRYVQGTLKKMKYHRKKGIFSFIYQADPEISQPTEVFVPHFQFAKGYEVSITGGSTEISKDNSENLVRLMAKEKGEISVVITRNQLKP